MFKGNRPIEKKPRGSKRYMIQPGSAKLGGIDQYRHVQVKFFASFGYFPYMKKNLVESVFLAFLRRSSPGHEGEADVDTLEGLTLPIEIVPEHLYVFRSSLLLANKLASSTNGQVVQKQGERDKSAVSLKN